MGVAIGDALAMARVGLTPEQVLHTLGRKPLSYRLWPGKGLYSDKTQLVLMAGQAILQSRSQSEVFHACFRRRLRWYVLSLPVGLSMSTFCAGLKSWLSWAGVKSEQYSTGNSSATRSLLLGVVLHNTGHRYASWARNTAAITHGHPLVGDAAAVLATASQIAAVTSNGRMNKEAALDTLRKTAKEEALRDALGALLPFLQGKSPPRAVAAHLGWPKGMPEHILPTTVMAIYCFLRYSDNFDRAVRSALLLGGYNNELVASVGGLVGAHVGVDALPKDLCNSLNDWPHDRIWIERLAMRLADWPHGIDDLLIAPPLPSYPAGQMLRTLVRWPLAIVHALTRIPCRLLRRS